MGRISQIIWRICVAHGEFIAEVLTRIRSASTHIIPWVSRNKISALEMPNRIEGCPIGSTLDTLHTHSLAEFKKHFVLERYDWQAIQKYFLSFGHLIGFAAIFGITDLHSENIMATEEGAALIDAEMGLEGVLYKSPTDRTHLFPYRNTERYEIDLPGMTILEALKPPRCKTPTTLGGVLLPIFDTNTVFYSPVRTNGLNEMKANSLPFVVDNTIQVLDHTFYKIETDRGQLFLPQFEHKDLFSQVKLGINQFIDRMIDIPIKKLQKWTENFSKLRCPARAMWNTSDMQMKFYTILTDYVNEGFEQGIIRKCRDNSADAYYQIYVYAHLAIPAGWYIQAEDESNVMAPNMPVDIPVQSSKIQWMQLRDTLKNLAPTNSVAPYIVLIIGEVINIIEDQKNREAIKAEIQDYLSGYVH